MGDCAHAEQADLSALQQHPLHPATVTPEWLLDSVQRGQPLPCTATSKYAAQLMTPAQKQAAVLERREQAQEEKQAAAENGSDSGQYQAPSLFGPQKAAIAVSTAAAADNGSSSSYGTLRVKRASSTNNHAVDRKVTF